MNYEKIAVAEARKAENIGKSVLLQGWVRTRRDSKAGFSFVELNDGSSFGNVQILVPKELPNYETDIKLIAAGSSIAVQGDEAGKELRDVPFVHDDNAERPIVTFTTQLGEFAYKIVW